VFDPGELGLSLSFGVEVFTPGHCTPLHTHHVGHELFFVLSGEWCSCRAADLPRLGWLSQNLVTSPLNQHLCWSPRVPAWWLGLPPIHQPLPPQAPVPVTPCALHPRRRGPSALRWPRHPRGRGRLHRVPARHTAWAGQPEQQQDVHAAGAGVGGRAHGSLHGLVSSRKMNTLQVGGWGGVHVGCCMGWLAAKVRMLQLRGWGSCAKVRWGGRAPYIRPAAPRKHHPMRR